MQNGDTFSKHNPLPGRASDARTFRALLRSVPPIPDSANCGLVLDRFAASPELQTLAVVDDRNVLIGVVVRANLIASSAPISPMVQFIDRPVTDIADAGYLVIDLHYSMAEVVDKVIHCAEQQCPVDVPVVDRGEYLGLISLREILRHILERDRDDLYYLAYFDPLTGLPNRLLFHDRLEQACHSAARSQLSFAMAFIDLDHFKLINDTQGHHVGDRVLQVVGERLQSCLRESDTVARLAGDEFVIIVNNVRDAADVIKVSKAIQTRLTDALPPGLEAVELSASIGIALCPLDDVSPQGLLLKADAAMYEAKSQGRNRFSLYSQQCTVPAGVRQSLNRHITKALDYDELTLVYQPVFSLETHRIVSVEALLRWQHPELGLMNAGSFLATAESAGAMERIGTWVLSSACRQQMSWAERGLPRLRVSVNLSAGQYRSPRFCATVDSIIRETGIDPRFLELEASERMFKGETEQGRQNLAKLLHQGIGIGIDDFGKGFCHWNELRKLPITHLKIDGSIIRNIHASETSIALFRTLTQLAQHLKLDLIAEAVESEAEVNCLQRYDCRVAQGHVFGQPLPAERFESWYRQTYPGHRD
jgi:diguanylate cyclase (GGDEF)-like protein